MKRIAFVLLILIIVSAGCAVYTETVKQDGATIDELKTILNESDDQTVKNTVQALFDSPVKIERTYIEVKGEGDMCSIGNQEVTPYFANGIPYNVFHLINVGKYVRYACKYSKEYKSGITKLYHISVYVEVDENNGIISPIHMYAYNRVLEKRTGILEPYTAPEWKNSIIVVGKR